MVFFNAALFLGLTAKTENWTTKEPSFHKSFYLIREQFEPR